MIVFKFEFANGRLGEKTIIGDFYGDEVVATEKAVSEFIDEAYNTKICNFDTYITNFNLGEIISVRGLPYKIVSIIYRGDALKIVTSITGERYEI